MQPTDKHALLHCFPLLYLDIFESVYITHKQFAAATISAVPGLEIIMEKLLAIMQELRQKCPWDQQQTPESLTCYAIEEAYEVEAAIREGDVDQIR